MKKTFQFSYIQHDSLDQAPEDICDLMIMAQEVREKAYAPYSKFLVGAAIRDSQGNIYLGNNQENAAYPSGLCAERVAIFHAGAINPDAIFTDLAVTVRSLNKKIDYPTSPCGACRQVMVEFCEPDMPVLLTNTNGDKYETTVKELLPGAFQSEDMV